MSSIKSRENRIKLSTTVARETQEFLQKVVESGEASTIAEALDVVIARIRQQENRKNLARATSEYFNRLDNPAAVSEEEALSHDMAAAAGSIDFDKEL